MEQCRNAYGRRSGVVMRPHPEPRKSTIQAGTSTIAPTAATLSSDVPANGSPRTQV